MNTRNRTIGIASGLAIAWATLAAGPAAAQTLIEVTPPATGVTASGSDGNPPANTVDNNLATRWSANGDGAWIRFDLGTLRLVAHVSVAVYHGDSRHNRFDQRRHRRSVERQHARRGDLRFRGHARPLRPLPRPRQRHLQLEQPHRGQHLRGDHDLHQPHPRSRGGHRQLQ
jgi:hypothetical protein